MAGIFDPKNDLWRTVSAIADVCCLSLMWVIACLPVVTIGPATAALYFSASQYVRHWEVGAIRGFLRSFRQNLRQGILASLILVPLAVLLYICWDVLAVMAGEFSGGLVLLAAYTILLLLPVGIGLWVFPLLGRFTFSLGGLFRTAASLTMVHLPTTLAVTAVAALSLGLCVRFLLPVFFLPALTALAHSFLMERVFRRYAPEEEAAEALEEEEEDLGN